MSAAAYAWSQGHRHMALEDHAPDAVGLDEGVRYPSKFCSVDKCTELRGQHAGRGYCHKHARRFYRNGYTETREEHTRAEFLRVAAEGGDAIALGRAAVAWRVEKIRLEIEGAPDRVTAETLNSAEGRDLVAAAEAYAEHPAEATIDTFRAALDRLDRAARGFFKARCPVECAAATHARNG